MQTPHILIVEDELVTRNTCLLYTSGEFLRGDGDGP